ncbi:MAG TPA: HEAT repeat domain-containing protein [Verrucomicrobiae bacterium]|jgi:HEAT repeat protein|nr:HEAT repeat domain-containing protein [Verrucomicrobiae bacterium]
MRQSRRILFISMAVIFAAAFAWFVLKPREPSYQGKTLTGWLEGFYSSMQDRPDAINALHHISSNAIPTLLNYVAAKDSRLEKSLLKWNEKHPRMTLPLYPETEKQELADQGFQILGPDAKSAVPQLIALLKDDDENVRLTAAYCLGCIGDEAKSAVPDLIKEFEREESVPPNYNPAAACALGKIGPSARAAIPVLTAGLTNRSPNLVVQAALINLHAASITPIVEQLKDTTKQAQWIRAMLIARWCGTNASPAIPLFISALNSTNGMVVDTSLVTFGYIHEQPETCIPVIVPFLASKNVWHRFNALESLRMFGKAAKLAVPELIRCLDDPELLLRKTATNALREIDPEAAAQHGIQ